MCLLASPCDHLGWKHLCWRIRNCVPLCCCRWGRLPDFSCCITKNRSRFMMIMLFFQHGHPSFFTLLPTPSSSFPIPQGRSPKALCACAWNEMPLLTGVRTSGCSCKAGVASQVLNTLAHQCSAALLQRLLRENLIKAKSEFQILWVPPILICLEIPLCCYFSAPAWYLLTLSHLACSGSLVGTECFPCGRLKTAVGAGPHYWHSIWSRSKREWIDSKMINTDREKRSLRWLLSLYQMNHYTASPKHSKNDEM